MAPFPYIDLRACADLRVLLARELANVRQWRCEFTEAKAHSAEAITSSRKLMAELDAVPAVLDRGAPLIAHFASPAIAHAKRRRGRW